MRILSKATSLSILLGMLATSGIFAAPPVIINNNIPEQQANSLPPSPPPPPTNYVPIDPREPPSGAYSYQSGNGASEQVYTTGEKRPYLLENNSSTQAPVIQPYINTPGGGEPRRE